MIPSDSGNVVDLHREELLSSGRPVVDIAGGHSSSICRRPTCAKNDNALSLSSSNRGDLSRPSKPELSAPPRRVAVIVNDMSEVNISRLDTGLFDYDKAESSAGWIRELQGEHTPETEEYGISSFYLSGPPRGRAAGPAAGMASALR